MKITSQLYHYVTAHDGKQDINARYNKQYMHFAFYTINSIP